MKTKIIQHQENSEFGYFDKGRTVIHESCDSCNSKQSRIEELEQVIQDAEDMFMYARIVWANKSDGGALRAWLKKAKKVLSE